MTATRLGLTCRELEATDEDALVAMFARSSGHAEMHFFDPFPLTADYARRLVSEPRRDRYYVAVLDREIVGLSMLRGWDEGYDIPSFGIMVDPGWRGQALGSTL